jgi:hypothetical protein
MRLSTLTSQSLWFDEAQLAHEAGGSLGGLIHTLSRQEFSPPLYFVLAWGWAKLFGVSALALRSLSALFGVATIAVTYGCGRELVSRRAGLVAALLVAISPFMVWYSQEAREYMLLALTSALSLLGFAQAWRAPRHRALALWAAGSALALLTHFFAAFLVAPAAVLLLWRHRVRATAVAVALPGATGLALLPLALSDAGHPVGWLNAVSLSTRIEQAPVVLALNTLGRTTAGAVGLVGAAILVAVLILLLVGAASDGELRGAAIAAGLAAAVILLPLAAALLGHDFFIARALMPAWVPLAVVLGAAVTVRRWRLAGAGLGAACLAAFAFAGARINSDPALQRPDWRAVAAALGPAATPRAVVALDGTLASGPLSLYLPGARWNQPSGRATVGELDVVAGPLELPGRLPAGVRLRSRRRVAGFTVTRFALDPEWSDVPGELASRAAELLSPVAGAPAVVIQQPRGPSTG